MPRPQFTLKTMLWLTLVVAAFFAGAGFERWYRTRNAGANHYRGWQPLHGDPASRQKRIEVMPVSRAPRPNLPEVWEVVSLPEPEFPCQRARDSSILMGRQPPGLPTRLAVTPKLPAAASTPVGPA